MIDQTAQTVKDAVDIADLMRASGVKLFGSGDELSARCPFHGEDRRPSMSVSRSKGLFFCHACGASGDALCLAFLVGGQMRNRRFKLLRLAVGFLGSDPVVSCCGARAPKN